ncbi:hypothetical protein MTP06_35480 [Streptomyces sp. PLM4]|nr:hypothetical protein MTP06_35480 [Streptomyces sp. PLM4]
MQTGPDDDHAEEAEDQDKGGHPEDAAPRYVRCPMLACGRLHDLPPDRE